MHNTQPVAPLWHARASVRNLTAVVSLSLATLAVVLAFEAAPNDVSPFGGWVPYFNQVGAALAGESMSPHANDGPSTVGSSPAAPQGDPSVPAITFQPNAADAQIPAAPTF